MSFVLFRVRYVRKPSEPAARVRRLLSSLRNQVPELDPEWIQQADFVEQPEVGILVRLPEAEPETVLDRLREVLDNRRVRYDEQRLVPEEILAPFGRDEPADSAVMPGAGSEVASTKLLESGKAFSHMGMLDDAVEQLRRAVELNPRCTEAYHYLVAILRQLGRLPEVETTVMRGLRCHAESSSFHYLVATVARELGRLPEAVNHLKAAIRLDPDAGILYSSLGDVLLEDGEIEAARLAYEEALARETDLAEAAAGLGGLLLHEGRLTEAADWLARAVSVQPTLTEARLKLGWTYFQMGQSEPAEMEFLQVANGPDADYHFSARFCLGRLYLGTGNLALAEEVLQEVCDLQPDLGEGHRLLAEVCSLQGDHERALLHWHEAMRLLPDQVEALKPHLALCLSRAERYDEAEKLVREVLASGESAELFEVLASVAMAREEWEKAQDALRCGEALDPESAMIAFQLGWVAENLEEVDEAMRYYNKATRLDPSLYEAYAGLGWLYYGQERYEVALVLFEKALELLPDCADFMDHVGWVHLLLRHYGRALELFELALDHEPHSDFILSHRAAALFHLGRIEEAREDVQRVIEAEPEPMVEAFARYLLGLILQAEGRKEQAAAEFAKSRASDVPPEFVALTTLSGSRSAVWKGYRKGKRKDSDRTEDLSSVAGE